MILFVGVIMFKELLCWGIEIFYNLKLILSKCGLEIVVGDEGGFVFKFEGIEDVVEIII